MAIVEAHDSVCAPMRREQLVVGVVFALCCVLFLVRDRIAAGGLLSSSASAAALRGGDTDWEPDLSASPALLCNGVLKWGEARGILSSSVACADIDVGGGVVIGGLVATKNISEKEVVMSVPKGSLVGAWAVHGSRLAKPARELGGAIDSVSLSILFLLNEVHVRQSSWTPYLRYLWSLNVNPAYMWSDAKLAEEVRAWGRMGCRGLGLMGWGSGTALLLVRVARARRWLVRAVYPRQGVPLELNGGSASCARCAYAVCLARLLCYLSSLSMSLRRSACCLLAHLHPRLSVWSLCMHAGPRRGHAFEYMNTCDPVLAVPSTRLFAPALTFPSPARAFIFVIQSNAPCNQSLPSLLSSHLHPLRLFTPLPTPTHKQGSIYLRKEVAKERADIREAYEKLFPLLSTKYPSVFAGRRAPYFSLEKFTKAWAIFHTRNWFLPLGGKVNHAFMAPVIDMLNYPPSLGGSTYVDYNEETFSFELIATKEIKAGEEVYFYYGKYCKDKALLTYGFSLPKMKDRCT